MIRHSRILLACLAGTLCLCALATFPVSAAHSADTDGVSDPGQHLANCLTLLEERGNDVTEIQTAFESGDMDQVHLLLEELHHEGLIGVGGDSDVSSSGDNECGRDRTGELKRKEQIEEHIEMIEEQGVCMADIRTALELGDVDVVRVLMAELREEYALQEAEGSGCDEQGGMRGRII